MSGLEVRMHVASFNTAAATELCIRSMRHTAGMPFALTVGDGGSHDRSPAMLQRYSDAGVIDLQTTSEPKTHAAWLDEWFAACPERYCGFSDSDVEYLGAGWLRAMVDCATEHNAALVATRIQARGGVEYRHPATGAQRVLAPRPEPWLLLIDTEQTRGRVHASFAYEDRMRDDGAKVAYDTAAAFFEAVEGLDLVWVEMPESFARSYRHFGGLSWNRASDRRVALQTRARQLAKRTYVWSRLQRSRLLHGSRTALARRATAVELEVEGSVDEASFELPEAAPRDPAPRGSAFGGGEARQPHDDEQP